MELRHPLRVRYDKILTEAFPEDTNIISFPLAKMRRPAGLDGPASAASSSDAGALELRSVGNRNGR